jgi:hypothetical protein
MKEIKQYKASHSQKPIKRQQDTLGGGTVDALAKP